ncbi:MAG: PAS domain-containing protein [Candidatus Aegiribacteria sp.]|nr:PAS domain-containing protein [Candidatus Aegiribacteria sp.]
MMRANRMNNDTVGSLHSRGWVRISWTPDSGVSLVSGDSEGLLGVSARRLINSTDSLTLLPTELATILAAGLPDIPVHLSTSSLTGSVTTVKDQAEVVIFGIPGFQSRSNIMLDELGAGIVGTDRTGNITLWNKAMSTIFRIPQKHVIGKNINDILVSPVLYSWENVVKMVLDGKQMKVVCRPDAQRRIECTFTPGSSGMVGTCFDTTESFQAENRLRTSRKMNQAYFNSVNTGLVLFDRDYRILVANRAFGRMFGLVENLLGIHLHEILPSESYEIIEDLTRLFFSSYSQEKEDARTARFTLPDRTRRIILQNVHPIMEDHGEVFYAVGIFEDISDITIVNDNYRNCLEIIKKINHMADTLLSTRTFSTAEIAEKLRDCIDADAVAIYLSDPLSDSRLAGCTSGWPDDAPEIFLELRLAPVLLDSDTGYRLTGDDMGVLDSWFKGCLVFPLESERKTYGYIIMATTGSDLLTELFPFAEILAKAVRAYLNANEYEAEIEHLDLLISRQNKFAGTMIDSLDVPVALFRIDWSVILWNKPMEELTGVSRDLATAGSELAASILFEGIGGISAAQRFIRNGSSEFPESWEIENQDGETARCTWRLLRTESVESRNLEPVIIVAGVESDDVYSISAAKKAAETYSALSRGTSALLSASDRIRVKEAAAAALLEISGASRVTLKIRGANPVTRTSYDQKTDGVSTHQWTIPLETDTEIIGECLFHGGREYSILKDYARNVARTCVEREKSTIGRRFAFIAERAAGKFLISNSSGKILLSTWMDVSDGGVSNRTIYDMFSGTEWSHLDASISGILKLGRMNLKLMTESGEPVQMAAVALDGHVGESLIIWWPVSDPSYLMRLKQMESAEDSGYALRGTLESLLKSISTGFMRVKKVLNPDHPVAAVLNTAKYAFEGMEKGYLYLRMIQMSLSTIPERVSTEFYLDKVISSFIEAGMLSPVVSISGDLYDISGSIELMQRVTLQLCSIVCPEAAPTFRVSVIRRKNLEYVGDLYREAEDYVKLEIRKTDGSPLKALPAKLFDPTAQADYSGGIPQTSEISLLCLILQLTGSTLRKDEENGSLYILFPCMD